MQRKNHRKHPAPKQHAPLKPQETVACKNRCLNSQLQHSAASHLNAAATTNATKEPNSTHPYTAKSVLAQNHAVNKPTTKTRQEYNTLKTQGGDFNVSSNDNLTMRAFSVNLPIHAIKEIDALVKEGLYPTRTEALRHAVRDLLKLHNRWGTTCDPQVLQHLHLNEVTQNI